MTVTTTQAKSENRESSPESSAREVLIGELPCEERRLELAGISTAVLEGGEGPPVILLHEQGTFNAHWMHVIPELVAGHRVVAPDLPGHGASAAPDDGLDAERMIAWLAELIEATCDSPPALVGHMGGGAIAARFAAEHGERLGSLVLVDSFGLGKFRPGPGFALALFRYVSRPTPRTYDGLMQRCTVDFDGVRAAMGARWEPFAQYTVDRARTPETKAALRTIMGKIAVPAIPSADLERIAVPTTLIWGREDPVNRLRVAQRASERYGWPLHVIEGAGDDPPIEQPEALLEHLEAAFAAAVPGSAS